MVSGLALCLFARGERRHPDRSRAVRGIMLAAGILLIALGLLNASVRQGFVRSYAVWYVLWRVMHGPWVSLVISILACTYALDIGKRGRSQMLKRLSQPPLWTSTLGLIVWLLNIDQFFRPLSSLVLDAVFPLSMIVMLAAMVRVLLSGAREADLNWISDS